MFSGGILRGMRSMVPKFAFLVLKIGLKHPPPNLRIFQKKYTYLNYIINNIDRKSSNLVANNVKNILT